MSILSGIKFVDPFLSLSVCYMKMIKYDDSVDTAVHCCWYSLDNSAIVEQNDFFSDFLVPPVPAGPVGVPAMCNKNMV